MTFQVFKGAIGFVRYVSHAHDLRKQFICFFELHDVSFCFEVSEAKRSLGVFLIIQIGDVGELGR